MSNTIENPLTNNNKTTRSKTAKDFLKRKVKVITQNQLAVEETKKLYQKYYQAPNPLFISQLKTDTINIYLSNYKLNDISVINKILLKYKYTANLTLSATDPNKSNSKKIRNKNSREPMTEGERVKFEKEERDKKLEYVHIINKITLGIGKHLFKNEKLKSFSLLNLELDQKLAHNLSYGITNNEFLKSFRVNNCKMDIQSYEILLKGLFGHKNIEKLDLQNNYLNDGYGNMIGRIITRQTDRRDEVIWSYALRNEFPKTNDYKNGLIFINLSGNYLSSYSADCITRALSLDQYVRSIILTNNKFDAESCKKFIYMLRKNMTLLNIDLKSNPGYNDNIQKRLIIKMSKNIKNLYIKYKNNEIDGNEFESYKKYINSSLFFNVDIPEDIVENYNSFNSDKIPEDNGNNSNNVNINSTEDNNKENGMVLKNKNNENNININNKIINNRKNKNKGIIIPQNKSKTNYNDEDTKKLIEENLSLKKKILELKSENLKNITGKKINLPNNYKSESLNQNFKEAEELLDKLNIIMNKIEKEESSKKNSGKKESNKINYNNIKNNNKEEKIKIKNIAINDKKEEKNVGVNDINKEKKKDKSKDKDKKEIKLNIDDDNKITFKKEDNNMKMKNNKINNNINKQKEVNNINKDNFFNKNQIKNTDIKNAKKDNILDNQPIKNKEETNIKKDNIIKDHLFKNNIDNSNKKDKFIDNDSIKNNKEIDINNNINKSDKKKDIINNKINDKKEEIKKDIAPKNEKLVLDDKEEDKDDDAFENLDENDEIMLRHRIIFEQLKKEYEAKGMKFEMEDYLELLQQQGEEEEEEEYDGF